jgi:GEVED domain/Secretion system C-terminal sorting domain
MIKFTVRCKSLLLLAAFVISATAVQAQLAMTRSVFNATYTPIVGGTTSTATGDDAFQQNIPIGFTFNYLSATYTQLSVSTNGWLSLANLAAFDAFSPNLYSTTNGAVLAPWWDDLTSSAIVYQTTGTPGSQVFTMQWTSLSYYFTSTRTINYQVKLYEATGVIEFWYGAAPTGTINTSESAAIGIKSVTGGNGQYLDAVTGSCFTGNSSLQSDRWPAYNFRFTPGAPTPLAGGTYNVGVGQTYRNLNEAAADVNHRGISGAVTFNLVDAQYDVTAANGSNFFPILIGPVTGSSAANTITFTKSATAAIVAYAGASGTAGAIANQASTTALASNVDPVFGLVGADYVTLNNLDIRGNIGNQVCDHGVGIYNSSATDGATNNIISNVTVTMNRANTGSRGFLSNVITTPTAASGANSNNTFRDFSITNVYAGIQLLSNATNPDQNTQIIRTNCATYNTIGNPATANDIGNGTSATYGILATNLSGFTISNNSIRNVSGNGSQTDGIVINTFQGTSTISNNKIQTVRNISTTSTTGIAGIRMSHTTTGTHTLRVFNNSVSEITSAYTGAASAARTLKGIFINGTGGATTQAYEIYNNSVSINGSGSLNLSSAAFEVNTTTGPIYTVQNNIFANFTPAQTGIARHFVYVTPTATAIGNTGTVSNYNDLYLANDAGVTGFLGQGAAVTYTTLVDWQTAMVGMDVNSVSLDPLFINPVSDLGAGTIALNSAGTAPPAYITADLNCAPRTPDNDIGAYIINGCTGTPTAGSITGVASVCSGLGTTLTLTGSSSGGGITYQWASATTSGGPYTTLLGTSNTQATGPLTATTYYVVTVTCTSSGLSATTSQFTVSVNALPTVAVTPSTGSICLPAGSPVALTASGGATYAWLPATGLSATTGANVSANPAATTTYTVTGTDANGCVNTATAAITVGESPSFSAVTATPAAICNGGTSQLQAAAATTTSYTGAVIPYTLIPTPGSGVTTLANAGVAVTPLSSGTLDDGGWQNLAIPFNFMFFGTSYNSFAVSSNGFMVLGAGAPNTFTGYYNTWPSAFAPRPVIGPVCTDMDFRTAGTINYFVTGTAPNRRLVVNWTAGNFYSATGSFTTQVVIFESTNVIEVHTTSSTGNNAAVQGIQNAAGTTAFVAPGRNNVTWTVTVPDGYRWSPSGGTPTYSWSPATFLNNTAINNPLASAVTASTTYTVTATNGSCTSTQTVAITAGSALSATATASPAATVCAGSNITLNGGAVGGGAPFTYTWTGPNSFTSSSQNPTISAVTTAATGTYTLTINDGCASTASVTIAITVNGLPTVTATPASGLICLPGGSPVTITAGGASTYTWSPTTALTPSTGAVVSANPTATTTYTVTGTGTNGCVNTATATITVGQTLTMNSVTATPSTVCSGGSSVLAASASLPPAVYCQPTYATGTGFGDYISSVVLNTLNNPTAASPSPYYTLYPATAPTTTTLVAGNTYTITLSAGTYTLNDIAVWIDYNQNGVLNNAGEKIGEANDIGAAPATTSFTFTVPLTALNGQVRLRVREMDYGGTGTMDPCITQSSFGETEDYIITITGGAAPATYSWSPGTFLSSTTGASVNATAVTAATTYTATATSSSGCTATGTVTISLPSALTSAGSASPSNTVCASSNVTLSATPTGGLAPYTYAWTGPNSYTASTASPVITAITTAGNGTYTCVITDNCGTTSTVTVSLTVNPLPVVAISGTSSICAGGSTLLTGTSGGTSQWYRNGVLIPSATSNTYTATLPGVYNMIKANLNGCADSAATGLTLVVNALPTVTASATATTVCSGDTVIFTGNGAASYVWSGGVTNAVATAVTTGGFYSVVGTDANGCTDADSIQIIVNALPTVTAAATSTTVCSGDNVTFSGSGATTYVWSGGVTDAVPFAVTTGGFYTVVGTNANGCTDADSVQITVNALPVVVLGADTAQCGGSVVLNAGNAGATFMWSTGGPAQTETVSTSGSYSVMVTDSNNCSSSDTISVTINALPVVALGADTLNCNGAAITLDAGNAGASYLWSDTTTAQTNTVTVSGLYSVMVTDSNGCMSSDTIQVSISNGVAVALGADTTVCGGPVVLDAGNAGSTYLWSDSTSTQTNTVSASGSYSVMVTDANGCMGNDTISIVINALPIVSFSIVQDTICTLDNVLTLTGTPAGGAFTGPGVSGTTFTPLTLNGNQTIQYTYTDSNGCSAIATDVIFVDPCTGVSDPSQSFTNTTIYPNPNQGQFIIDLGYVPNDVVNVEVMNSIGQLVQAFTITTTNKQVDLSNYEGGIYLIRITDGANTTIRRVVKQ